MLRLGWTLRFSPQAGYCCADMSRFIHRQRAATNLQTHK
jgi:hypothetical protein